MAQDRNRMPIRATLQFGQRTAIPIKGSAANEAREVREDQERVSDEAIPGRTTLTNR
jgi:hypothetical protein